MKNRYTYLLIFFVLIGLLSSCSKFEVSEDININIAKLTTSSIETNLDIVNLEVNSNEFATMMKNYEQDVKIEAVYSMYSGSDTIVYGDSVRINIKGNGSAVFDLKSLSIKFHKSVHNNSNEFIQVDKHLTTHYFDKIKKISLRNSGNDCEETFIKDISYTQLAINMNLDVELSYFKPVQVFINNTFYGLLNLRTEKNDDALSHLLKVEKYDLNIIKLNAINGYEDIEFTNGDDDIMQLLVDAVFNGDLNLVKSKIDISSFIDYVVFQDLIGNSDWPHNNVQLYSVGDGKFRFFLFDMDIVSVDDKYFVLDNISTGLIVEMYKLLKQDSEIALLIKKKQSKIFHFCTNELFRSIVDANANIIENEIDYNISKYNLSNGHVRWYLDIEKLLDQYKIRRENYRKHYSL